MSVSHRSHRSYSQTKSDKSYVRESDEAVMQKEAERCTKQAEMERKKLFNLKHQQDEIRNEMEEKKQKITFLKKQLQNEKTKLAIKNCQTLNLQIKYLKKQQNETSDKVQSLIEEIDELRRKRAQFYDQYYEAEKDLQEKERKAEEFQELIEKRKSKVVQTQEYMYELKMKNDEEKENYKRQFEILSKQLEEEQKQKELMKSTLLKSDENQTQPQQFDTQSILKKRLQKIIFKNKEKVKIMDQYMRNMIIIDDCFNQIKEITGITDIHEIQNTFIKSEEQNYALLTYVDLLHQQIDNLEDQNREITAKIEEQEAENSERQRILTQTPDEEKFKRRVGKVLEIKNAKIQEFQDVLEKIQPHLEEILIQLVGSKFNLKHPHKLFEYQNGISLNYDKINGYLEDMDDFLYELIHYTAEKQNQEQPSTCSILLNEIPVKDFKAKQIPAIQINNEDNPLDNARLLDKNKLIEIANEQLDKRKNQALNQKENKKRKEQNQSNQQQ